MCHLVAPALQPKLGSAHDRFEREADRVAHQVTGHPVPRRPDARGGGVPSPDPQRAHGAAGGALDAGTRQAVRHAGVGGHPIPGRLRAAMEGALGTDLSGVRIHTGRRADQFNGLLQARAFTTGQHVFFRHGACDPVSPGGMALLAHELTHVVQQQGAASRIQRDFQPEYQFNGRYKTIVGVGEKVKLSVTNPNAGNLTWIDDSPEPLGKMRPTAPTGETEYTAGRFPGTATLTCRDGKWAEVHRHQVAILAPSGGYMRQAPGTQTRHLPNSWNVSFVGNPFLEPTKVSFHNIEFSEGEAPARYRPSKRDWRVPNQQDHKAGPWVDVAPAVDGKDGSKCSGDDWVSSGNHTDLSPRPPGKPATMTWRIPWYWRLAGTHSPGRKHTKVDHVAYDYGQGKARLTKGGVDVSADATDPAQWFYSVNDTITQIRGYYARHPQAYGGPWANVEVRLRGFSGIGPLADLLAAAREGTWDPNEYPPNTSLNDLIDVAARLWGVPVP